MAANVETGFLVIADITGYTAYLARSEIEHAPTIAGDLLETVVGRLEPPFRLAKLEGDACFLYAEDGRAEPALLLDALAATYLAFRRRLRSIETATSCECNSCGLAPRLNLKLFVHHGSYVLTRIAGREELAGPDVILVHRLLKGAAAGQADRRGFAAFSAAATGALGIDVRDGAWRAVGEELEHIGPVQTHVLDLEQLWHAESGRRRLDLAGRNTVLDISTVISADPATVWAYLTSPALRPAWEGPIVINEQKVGGRRGVGTSSQCVTGRLSTLEEIVDWQPYDHVGYRLAVPGVGPVEATVDLEEGDGQTQVRLRWAVATSGADRSTLDRQRGDKMAAYARLARLLGAGTGRHVVNNPTQEVPA